MLKAAAYKQLDTQIHAEVVGDERLGDIWEVRQRLTCPRPCCPRPAY